MLQKQVQSQWSRGHLQGSESDQALKDQQESRGWGTALSGKASA